MDIANDPLYQKSAEAQDVINGGNFEIILEAVHEVLEASTPDQLARPMYRFLKRTLGMMINGQLVEDLNTAKIDEDDESAAPRRASIEDHEEQRTVSLHAEDRRPSLARRERAAARPNCITTAAEKPLPSEEATAVAEDGADAPAAQAVRQGRRPRKKTKRSGE